MNYWLKVTMCISTLLLGHSQSSLGAEEMNKAVQVAIVVNEDGTIPCGPDGIRNCGGCTNDPDCPELPSNIALTISRFTTSTLTNANADAILAKATDILQTDNASGDVACDVTFTRNGGVTVFTTGDGNIDTQPELTTVLGLSGYVKVVNEINFCGGAPNFNAVGCGENPGNSFAVSRLATLPHQEGIVWAHEYGHTQGLPHRSGDAVMAGTITPKNTRVNTTECNAYHN